MSRGWRRLGIVLSLAWLFSVSGYAIYEWQAPFFKKSVFFIVVAHPEAVTADGAVPVITPFLIARFVAVLVLPVLAVWVLLLVGPAIIWVRNGFKT